MMSEDEEMDKKDSSRRGRDKKDKRKYDASTRDYDNERRSDIFRKIAKPEKDNWSDDSKSPSPAPLRRKTSPDQIRSTRSNKSPPKLPPPPTSQPTTVKNERRNSPSPPPKNPSDRKTRGFSRSPPPRKNKSRSPP